MAPAALEREAVREGRERPDDIHDRRVDRVKVERLQSSPPFLRVQGVLHHHPGFGERLQASPFILQAVPVTYRSIGERVLVEDLSAAGRGSRGSLWA